MYTNFIPVSLFFLLELTHSKGLHIIWENISYQVYQVIPTLGGVREDSMTSALDDRWFWRLLATLFRMRFPMVYVFTLFFKRIPPRSVVKLGDAG